MTYCVRRGLMAALGLAVATAAGAAKPIVDVAEAGPDYAVQGEYLGDYKTAGGQTTALGVQVAALGDGKFAASFLIGGLPGDGWDNHTKATANGATAGDKTTFDGHGWTAEIAGDTMTGKTDQGEAFSLKKTVRVSPTLGAKPPADALLLLGPDPNPNLDAWNFAQVAANGWFCTESPKHQPEPITKKPFTDFTLHVEFMLPFEPHERSQARSNSGVYLQDRYEIQVLDSFGFKVGPGKPDGELCGDIYSKHGAATNAVHPPLTWNTYDVEFTAPRYENGKKVKNAVATVRLNGVLIQDHTEISGCTGGNGHQEKDEPSPLKLQYHHSPVFFRNIWIVEAK